MRKSDITSTSAIAPKLLVVTATPTSMKNIEGDVKREKPISSDYKKQQQLYKEDEESELVEVLNKMTDRNKKDIQESIAKLDRRDIERIKDLCRNYNKLQKYSKLITDTDNLQKFKTALQNEIGKKLSDHQLQHAANSIRKAKLYIENVLDGKFVTHGSYGINHTKHNLEYGYLIVGLMQPSKRRTVMTTTKERK